MLINDIINPPIIEKSNIRTMQEECSTFLRESNGFPLYKLLPSSCPSFYKAKVRLKKHVDFVSNHFNKAFETKTNKLRQRAIFAYSYPLLSEHAEVDLFYVFPINNYKFLYNKEIKNSNDDYKQIMETLVTACSNATATDIITEVLNYTYTTTNIIEGLKSNTEVILYNIPYYYAIKVHPYYTYKQIIS